MGISKSRSKESVSDKNCSYTKVKIAIVGTYAVGKTSIVNRFVWDRFSPAYVYTRGGNMHKKKMQVHGEAIELELIDTGGEEYQVDIIQTLYRKAHGIILVHDISKPQSFTDVDKWLTEIHAKCLGNPLIMLVGNKCDLDPDVDRDIHISQYSGTESKKKVKHPRCPDVSRVPIDEIEKRVFSSDGCFLKYYCEVSAKTTTNVEAMFELFVKEILHHNNNLVQDIWLNFTKVDMVGDCNTEKSNHIAENESSKNKSKIKCVIL